MADLMNSGEKLRERIFCAECQKPVEKVHSERDAALLRPRFVIECHGKVDFIHAHEPIFGLATAMERGQFGAGSITVFRPRAVG